MKDIPLNNQQVEHLISMGRDFCLYFEQVWQKYPNRKQIYDVMVKVGFMDKWKGK